MEHTQIELLAPAGRWEAMEKVAAAGADTVTLVARDLICACSGLV